MGRRLRENAICALLAGAGCATLAWLGLYGFAWNDYDNEARSAYDALLHGHLHAFLTLAPAYGGSLLERAPFAMMPALWGGGALAVYRMAALPCLLAGAILGVWLVARMRASGDSVLARAVALGICVANPITLRALELGHPEELLGACLCIAAVVLAAKPDAGLRRSLAAGLVLGLAIANKQWALLALAPVLLALPARRRPICLALAALSAACTMAPFALSSGGFLAGTRALASAPTAIFQPWQLWWFLGHHGALVHGLFGAPKPGYRTAVGWASSYGHALILAVGLALGAGVWLLARARGIRRLGEREALLTLALVLLLRCLLDTWDTVYYPLPFVLALLAWELGAYPRRPPVLALGTSTLVWISFQWLPQHVSPDAQAALFLAWTLPLLAGLGRALVRAISAQSPATAAATPARPARAQEMTVSSLDRLVRTS